MIIFIYLTLVLIALFVVARKLWPEMKKPPFVPNDNGHASRLETLLDEKTKSLQFLQMESKILRTEMRDFSKIKAMLEEEIRRLRDQNRIFRSELGLSSGAQQPEKSLL